MPKLSKYCFYLLALFLPIQTIFAQFFTVKLAFPTWLNFWKEILVAVIIFQFLFEIQKYFRKSTESWRSKLLAALPILILGLATIIVTLNSIIFGEFHSSIFSIGFRFELFWLWFFAVSATWLNFAQPQKTQDFKDFCYDLQKFILAGLSVVFLVILLEFSLGQAQVLQYLGFGQTSDSEFVISAPTCHVVDYGSDACRLSGTFSTPNHLAGYLLLILPILLICLVSTFHKSKKSITHPKVLFFLVYSLLAVTFISLTSARYAILALTIWVAANIINFWKLHTYLKKILLGLLFLLPLAVTLFPIYVGFTTRNPNFEIDIKYLPVFITKESSTVEHYRNTMASLSIFQESPQKLLTGLGLGNSGPAAKTEYQDIVNQNLLYKQYNYLTYRWYILPDRITIPENWYIQILLNGGLLYTILYLMVVFYPLKNILSKVLTKRHRKISFNELQIALGFFAVLSGNLFLHLWENQTISLYWTILWVWSYSLRIEAEALELEQKL
jgi:hypothetical protein